MFVPEKTNDELKHNCSKMSQQLPLKKKPHFNNKIRPFFFMIKIILFFLIKYIFLFWLQ